MRYNIRPEVLIDGWNVSPNEVDITELFSFFKLGIMAYLKEYTLTAGVIVGIIKDLREALNPTKDRDIYYFTDRICDTILCKFEGVDESNLQELMEFIETCEKQADLKH